MLRFTGSKIDLTVTLITSFYLTILSISQTMEREKEDWVLFLIITSKITEKRFFEMDLNFQDLSSNLNTV